MKLFKLAELVKIRNGKDHRHLSEGTYPVLGSGGILRYVNEYIYCQPSVLLPRKGSLENIQFCDTPFWTVDTLYYTEIDTKQVNPYYLYSYLKSLDLRNLYTGTGVPSMTFESYYSITLRLPSLEKQNIVANYLLRLDKKLSINRQINDNLEATAKQIYDYWFVQFDFPNEEGKPYKSSGGEMIWNEKLKRKIPQGWTVKSIFNEFSVQYGFPFSTKLFTDKITNIPIVRIRDILSNSISAYTLEEVDDRYLLNKEDLIIGMDGNFHMNYWNDNTSFLNQRSVRLRAKQSSTVSIIQAKYDILPFIKAKEQLAKGSTVGHLSDKDLKDLLVLVPPNNELKEIFNRLLTLLILNSNEIKLLTKLRDELLPLLMNGQVTLNYHLSDD